MTNGASVSAVTDSGNNGADNREDDVADMARRAALAASEKRRLARTGGDGPTAADVDQDMMNRLGKALDAIAAWSPGFAGAMLFRGEAARPLVSLITAGDREAMRRSLSHVATSVRMELDLIERDALGAFVDSVTSTSRGAILVFRLEDDLLVLAIEGQPARVADAWKAVLDQKAELAEAAAGLIKAR